MIYLSLVSRKEKNRVCARVGVTVRASVGVGGVWYGVGMVHNS